ncbi:MAG: Rne/Rng family ribonuclease [Deltaproteobacteria bacterium]|nr:Rne/Rng family ribonuclease [Deltaproteobacteria bacterium]
MSKNSLIINSSPSETRVALLENGQPVEVYIERRQSAGVVGNVYCGRVVRVLPGMQAAFVEIGLHRTGFLYVNDALPRSPDPVIPPNGETAPAKGGNQGSRTQPLANIADVLKQGQEILVQVQKEPIGTKGARLTRHVTLPGRHIVYMPLFRHLGVSHRIESEKERERLKKVLEPCMVNADGFIVRTAAEGIEGEDIEREAKMLQQLWKDVEEDGKKGGAPRLVYADADLVMRATRDLFNDQVGTIQVDRQKDFLRIREFVKGFEPGRESGVELYDKPEPIFDHFGIEVEIERALGRKVWLKSGGYIVIDQAEALTVVDVNSGRFVGKSNLEETITRINLEAVKETAYQMRLRNIGGIIIIDFIDMGEQANREKIHAALEQALERDRAKTCIVRMSEIGLVEMTRKRVRESLGEVLTDACSYCNGRGFIKSEQTVGNEVLRGITRQLNRGEGNATILVNMHPSIADYLYENESEEIEQLELSYKTSIIPVSREGYHQERFDIVTGTSA